jgi:DNA-binding PadR family transcriptional regulator
LKTGIHAAGGYTQVTANSPDDGNCRLSEEIFHNLYIVEMFCFPRETNLIEERANLLQMIKGSEQGIRELTKLSRSRNEDTIALLDLMEQEGLINYLEKDNSKTRGRPKKVPMITALGEQLLMDFQKCKRSLIQINDNDIKQCKHQVMLKNLLEENNVSPYKRFLEVTGFAFRIRNALIRQ